MRRRATCFAALFAVGLAACSDDGSPVVEAGPGAGATDTTLGASPPIGSEPVDATILLELTGDAEVPGPGSAGIATAELTYDGNQLCITGTTANVGPLIAGHVHAAPVGEAGDVVIDFELSTTADGPFESCEVVGAEGGVVVTDPKNYYVNLHTAEFPDGAVRAQLE